MLALLWKLLVRDKLKTNLFQRRGVHHIHMCVVRTYELGYILLPPGSIAQSVARLTADPGVTRSNPWSAIYGTKKDPKNV